MTLPRAEPTPGVFRSLLRMAGVAFVLLMVAQVEPRIPLAQMPHLLGGWALLWSLAAVWFVPGFLLAEEASGRVGHRVWIYAAVVVTGSAVVAISTVALASELALWTPRHLTIGQRFLRLFLEVFWRIGLAAMVYSSHRRALAAARRFQQLEIRRDQMTARLAESRLQTAQARVRPEAFIEQLRALRWQYLDGEDAAEASLEAMIVQLRTASRGTAR